jgi:retron-type reverse transcriptase
MHHQARRLQSGRRGRIGGGVTSGNLFVHITSVTNLLAAWRVFARGKKSKKDVAFFELYLEENIFDLHDELATHTYQHGPYQEFVVCDPKRRTIHKAAVRDRVLQQAVFQVLYDIFDPHFIFDSFSSRVAKGTHLGVARLESGMRKITKNWRRPGWALKCDVSKFFDSINHETLRKLIWNQVQDEETRALVDIILKSFARSPGFGLPLGNVTSQLLANVYLNELDQYVKHFLRRKYYFRYCDDFVILGETRAELEAILFEVGEFLHHELLLDLHPYKVETRKISQGVDFVGYVIFPHHRRLRTKTRRRVKHKVSLPGNPSYKEHQIISYFGVAGHAQERVLTKYLQKEWSKIPEEK